VGFSGDMARVFLEHPLRNPLVASFGIDIWMSTLAICHGVPICQSFLGRPKIHKTRDPASDIGPVFGEIVGALFTAMIHFSDYWKTVRWSRPTAIFGFGLGEVELPPNVEVSKSSIYQRFQQGIPACSDMWREVLGQEIFSKLTEVLGTDAARFEFPSDLWAKVLFRSAIAFAQQESSREAIVDALIPLYYARVYSYVQKTEEMSTQQAEEYIEEQCVVFEEARSFLDERWPL